MPVAAASSHQAEFDYLVWVSKPLLRVDEVCAILRKNKDTVYALADTNDLEAHQGDKAGSHITITRRSVVAYLAKTAKYVDSDFTETVFGLARRLNPAQRAALIKKLTSLNP